MNVWNQAPLVRLIFPFLTGIITAVYLPFQHPVFIFIIILLLVPVSLIVLIPFLNFSYRRSWWFGLFMNSALFLLGYQLTINKTSLFADTHFSKFITPETIVYAKLLQPCIEKERSMKTVMEVMAVKNNGQWINTSGKAMVYIKKDAFALRLKYGDEIIVNTDFKDVPSIQNPGEFNYKRFLAFHNVFQQAYI